MPCWCSARGRTHLDTPSLHHDVDLAYDDEPPLRRRRHSLHPSLPPKPQVDVNSKVDSSPSDPSPRALLDYSDL